jgi:hypothetical protein
MVLWGIVLILPQRQYGVAATHAVLPIVKVNATSDQLRGIFEVITYYDDLWLWKPHDTNYRSRLLLWFLCFNFFERISQQRKKLKNASPFAWVSCPT